MLTWSSLALKEQQIVCSVGGGQQGGGGVRVISGCSSITETTRTSDSQLRRHWINLKGRRMIDRRENIILIH